MNRDNQSKLELCALIPTLKLPSRFGTLPGASRHVGLSSCGRASVRLRRPMYSAYIIITPRSANAALAASHKIGNAFRALMTLVIGYAWRRRIRECARPTTSMTESRQSTTGQSLMVLIRRIDRLLRHSMVRYLPRSTISNDSLPHLVTFKIRLSPMHEFSTVTVTVLREDSLQGRHKPILSGGGRGDFFHVLPFQLFEKCRIS